MPQLFELQWAGTFDAAHFIPGHPKCSRLHGHTYYVSVMLKGYLSERRPKYMVDYGEIKDLVMQLDHKVIVPSRLHMEDIVGTCVVEWEDFGVLNRLRLAPEMVFFLPEEDSSAECIAQHIVQALVFTHKLEAADVTVKETPNTGARCTWTRENADSQ